MMIMTMEKKMKKVKKKFITATKDIIMTKKKNLFFPSKKMWKMFTNSLNNDFSNNTHLYQKTMKMVGRFWQMWMSKKKKMLVFDVGQSHYTLLWMPTTMNMMKKKKKKKHFIFFSYYLEQFKNFLNKVSYAKKTNLYTGSGFIFEDEKMMKKVGKMSKLS